MTALECSGQSGLWQCINTASLNALKSDYPKHTEAVLLDVGISDNLSVDSRKSWSRDSTSKM